MRFQSETSVSNFSGRRSVEEALLYVCMVLLDYQVDILEKETSQELARIQPIKSRVSRATIFNIANAPAAKR